MFDYDKLIKKCFEENSEKVKGVLHVGACFPCNQTPIYVANNVQDIVLVEASEILYNNLIEEKKQKIKNSDKILPIILNEVISNVDGEERIFHQYFNEHSSNKGSSSLLENDLILYNDDAILEKKIPVRTITIDSMFKKHSLDMNKYNFLVMDIQGSELDALAGASEYLKHVDFICCEVSYERIYKGQCTHSEIDNFLNKNGFIKNDYLPVTNVWGDAYYVRK